MIFRALSFVMIFAGAGAPLLPAQDTRPIEYTVELKAPQTQMVDIRMLVRNVSGGSFNVALPVWRPGRYEVIDPAGTVRNVHAQTASGQALAVEKIDKTTWTVTTNGAREVEVRYSIYANSLANRTRHVDDSHAFLSGSTVFFYIPERRRDPIYVHIDAPSNWKVATGMEAVGGNPRKLEAADYDVLADSPLEIGIHDLLTFDVDGKKHEIAIWGHASYDAEKLKTDFAKIVKAQAAVFGNMPYNRYVFLIHSSTEASGGTEHLNSTIMQTSPRAFENDDAYKRFLGLVSHEMFHTWNVKQLRPDGISPYDYAHENYTDLLWVSEGTTSYFGDLILARTGVNPPDTYLKSMGDAIQSMRTRPGSNVQSLAESSFDAWIKYNRPTADDVNATVSFYDKGELASFLLDMELRRRTGNRVALDAVIKELYRRFPLAGPGFSTADMINITNELAKSNFEEFFQKYISGTENYPFEEALANAGLELVFEAEKKEDAGKTRGYLGLTLANQNGGAAVRTVLSDGPAYRAGLIPGDEIVALNQRRLNSTEFDEAIAKMKAGDKASLHIVRRGTIRTIEVTVDGKPEGRWTLRRMKDATAAQKAAFKSWIGQDWPAEKQ